MPERGQKKLAGRTPEEQMACPAQGRRQSLNQGPTLRTEGKECHGAVGGMLVCAKRGRKDVVQGCHAARLENCKAKGWRREGQGKGEQIGRGGNCPTMTTRVRGGADVEEVMLTRWHKKPRDKKVTEGPYA